MFYKISRPSTYFNKDSRDMYVNTEDAANMVKNLLALIGIEVKVEKVCDGTSCRGLEELFNDFYDVIDELDNESNPKSIILQNIYNELKRKIGQ